MGKLLRVYVQDGVHDACVAKLAALKVGPASEPGSQIGPMINARAVEKMEAHIADACGRGARVVTGGERVRDAVADSPNYVLPTVLCGCNEGMLLAQEEIFGPVVPVFRFATEEEAVRRANDTPYGLAAYFCSQDMRRIARVADALETGFVGINGLQ